MTTEKKLRSVALQDVLLAYWHFRPAKFPRLVAFLLVVFTLAVVFPFWRNYGYDAPLQIKIFDALIFAAAFLLLIWLPVIWLIYCWQAVISRRWMIAAAVWFGLMYIIFNMSYIQYLGFIVLGFFLTIPYSLYLLWGYADMFTLQGNWYGETFPGDSAYYLLFLCFVISIGAFACFILSKKKMLRCYLCGICHYFFSLLCLLVVALNLKI